MILYQYASNTVLAGLLIYKKIGQFGNIPVTNEINADLVAYPLPVDPGYYYRYVSRWSAYIRVNDFIDNPNYQVYSGYPTRKRVGHYQIRRGDSCMEFQYINYGKQSTRSYCCFQGSISYGDDIMVIPANPPVATVIGALSGHADYTFGTSFVPLDTATDFSYGFENKPDADIYVNYVCAMTYNSRSNPGGSKAYDSFVYINL